MYEQTTLYNPCPCCQCPRYCSWPTYVLGNYTRNCCQTKTFCPLPAYDDEENFIESILPFIRGLPKQSKMRLRLRFQKILFDMTYKRLQKAPCTEWPPYRPSKPICCQDEDEIFFWGLIPYIKELNPPKRLILRHKYFWEVAKEYADAIHFCSHGTALARTTSISSETSFNRNKTFVKQTTIKTTQPSICSRTSWTAIHKPNVVEENLTEQTDNGKILSHTVVIEKASTINAEQLPQSSRTSWLSATNPNLQSIHSTENGRDNDVKRHSRTTDIERTSTLKSTQPSGSIQTLSTFGPNSNVHRGNSTENDFTSVIKSPFRRTWIPAPKPNFLGDYSKQSVLAENTDNTKPFNHSIGIQRTPTLKSTQPSESPRTWTFGPKSNFIREYSTKGELTEHDHIKPLNHTSAIERTPTIKLTQPFVSVRTSWTSGPQSNFIREKSMEYDISGHGDNMKRDSRIKFATERVPVNDFPKSSPYSRSSTLKRPSILSQPSVEIFPQTYVNYDKAMVPPHELYNTRDSENSNRLKPSFSSILRNSKANHRTSESRKSVVLNN